MHKFFETLMFYFDIMFSQMPIDIKIKFLLIGTHDQRFAGADAAQKKDRFQTYYGDWGSGNFLEQHPFLSQETTSRNTISHSRRHWELGGNLQENIIFSKFAL